ncbi:hypothetical protein M5M_03750 [Simiduia agarivorans SA1 = DSM 21679]|uniref:Tetratricopeptide repeat protein n=2 Tax=Simiduia TaxID=447467 RepID=K4KFV1_SIMAS|nr:hypothetical protein M5M_03750 [Simiduia agarivorans SA1 = DSM 21679]
MADMTAIIGTLDTALEKKLKALCAQGYSLYDQGDFNAAVRAFYQAWLVLPKPQTQYPQASWVLTALADGYHRAGKPRQALEAAQSALCCPGSETNFIALLRKGQALLDLGDTAAARIALYKVFNQQGQTAFSNEPPRYLEAIDDLVVS